MTMCEKVMSAIFMTLALLLSSCATTASNREKAGIRSEDSKLIASDAKAGAYFGTAVALKGNTAIIGAWGDNEGGEEAGSAYVFVRNANGWTEQQKMIASDAAAEDEFGISVSVDDDTAIIESVRNAYVFVRSGGVWAQQAKLTASDTGSQVVFSSSVSISGDTAIIGAFGAGDVGSAYVFVRDGETWVQQAKLTASDAETMNLFHISVSISGETAVIGAFGVAGSGHAYIFTRNGAEWTQQAKLMASDVEKGDAFGNSVSMDGDTVIVGAYQDSDKGKASGSAYIFTRTGGVWTQEAKLTADEASKGDQFGNVVSILGDTAIVGAYTAGKGEDDAGSTYFFTRDGGVWSQEATLTSRNKARGDRFGNSVSISGNTALVGAMGVKTAGDYSGAAYLFDLAKPKP